MKKTHVGNKSKHRATHASQHYLHRKAYNILYSFVYKRIRARESFIFPKTSTRALGTTQPSDLNGTATLSSRVKRSGRETDHSPLSSAEVKNGWCYTSIPPACLHGVHKGKFIYTPFNDAIGNSRLHTRINE
jgi:hypothetical protein